MPQTSYLNIAIASQPLDVTSAEDFPIAISYSLEDPEDFQKKESSMSFTVKVPATLQNRKIANSFENSSIEDLTPGQVYRSHRPAVIEADGTELLNGKAFLLNATHTAIPEEYEYDFYGGNGDWIIDAKEKTLYDVISHLTFLLTDLNVLNSWLFDGTQEALPYVFAPVRYRGLMDVENGTDDSVSTSYLRPSLSKYWVLYWGFKQLGYRIAPGFVDTVYFRRQVMPWTWGNFQSSEGTQLDQHKFLAKSTQGRFVNDEYDDFLEVYISDTGMPQVFDNNDEFSYANKTLTWQYKAPFQGSLDAHFAATVTTEGNLVGDNSFFNYYIYWYYLPAGSTVATLYKQETILAKNGANLSRGDFSEFNDAIMSNHVVNPGDKIQAKFYLKLHEGSGIGARVNFHTEILEFKRDFFKIPIGGTIDFANYNGFKKYKWLDYVAGVLDEFNISPVTDNVNKIVYLEPMHAYNVDGAPKSGYFNGGVIDWNDKIDLSKQAKMTLFSDYEKEVTFKYKDDTNDGVLKVVQDRNQNILAAAKYVFPDRFKEGKRDHENRFFSPTMHCNMEQWKGITGIATQMVCIIPENISNTSNSEADNTFTPKSCYYKGLVNGAGGWKFNGQAVDAYPYMFAVNYNPGGENDPVLSYTDEKIGNVIAQGLMKKFFAQRLAIMRNGQFYEPSMMLKNNDVNRQHREHKIVNADRWELVQINNYLPLKSESTACYLRKWSPVLQQDFLNSFPSVQSINGGALAGSDVKYAQLKCLTTDIPK